MSSRPSTSFGFGRGRTVIVFGIVVFVCGPAVVKLVTICVVELWTCNAVLCEAIVGCINLALKLMILRVQFSDSGSELSVGFG